MKNARGREAYCQEAGPLSITDYVPCGRPAVAIVDNGDRTPYWMCQGCADHNVRNRGAHRWRSPQEFEAAKPQWTDGYDGMSYR